MRHAERHLSHRENWLRAAVLGANDGVLSVAGLVIGVAAANGSLSAILTAGLAGTVAGALSMAAGEYVSVSSQRDAERADLRLEARELEQDPEGELAELAAIYERRGLSPGLSAQVARELSRDDRLATHARDELGIEVEAMARPLQAAWSSAVSFTVGAVVPLAAIGLVPGSARIQVTVAVTLVGLAILGAAGARLGGAPTRPAALRVLVWGALAMALTSGIGAAVGTTTGA